MPKVHLLHVTTMVNCPMTKTKKILENCNNCSFFIDFDSGYVVCGFGEKDRWKKLKK